MSTQTLIRIRSMVSGLVSGRKLMRDPSCLSLLNKKECKPARSPKELDSQRPGLPSLPPPPPPSHPSRPLVGPSSSFRKASWWKDGSLAWFNSVGFKPGSRVLQKPFSRPAILKGYQETQETLPTNGRHHLRSPNPGALKG